MSLSKKVAEPDEMGIQQNVSFTTVQRYEWVFLCMPVSSLNCVFGCKDVVRMMKLVHGTSSERLLIAMIRYAQEFGTDDICKAILLRHLEEPNCPDIRQLQCDHEGETTTSRDVGRHVQVAAQLLQIRIQEGKKMTMAKLVQDWRSRSEDAPQWYDQLSIPQSFPHTTCFLLVSKTTLQPKIIFPLTNANILLFL